MNTHRLAGDLLALTKPRITVQVVLTACCGLWLAPNSVGPLHAFWLLLGTALVVSSANTINMYIERDIDGRMARTRRRPLPDGRLRPDVALWTGMILGLLSLPVLALGVNPLTALLGLLSFIIYVAIYTPLKQRSPVALIIGAIPGAMPPLMGWTGATGQLSLPGLVLFGIMFCWQIPHFLAITLYRTEELARAGYKVTAASRGRLAAKVDAVLYLAALLPISLLLVPLRVVGKPYLVLAALAGIVYFAWGVFGLRREAGARWARQLFMISLLYITVLSVALAAGRIWGPI